MPRKGLTSALLVALLPFWRLNVSTAFKVSPLQQVAIRRQISVVAPNNNNVFRSIPTTVKPSPQSESLLLLKSTADPIASAEALNTIVSRSRITPLIQSKSDVQGFLQILWHGGLFLLAAFFHCKKPCIASLFSMAYVSSFFFHGLHETVHQTAFRSKWMNNVFAHMFGLLCMRPARHYYYYHWQHHRYTGNPNLDSELQQGSFLDIPVNSVASYLFYLSGIPFWIDAISNLVRHGLGNCSEMYLQSPAKAKTEVTTEARIYMMVYCLFLVASAWNPSIKSILWQYWVLPAMIGQPFLRFYLLAEHRGRRQTDFILDNTRTMDTNKIYRKLAWNMPYHMEHHAWPAVPFHKLKDAHELIMEATTKTNRNTNSNDDNNDDNNTGSKSIIDLREGELDMNLSSAKGYMAFQWAFLKSLFRKK